jgi:hypothetical protein
MQILGVKGYESVPRRHILSVTWLHHCCCVRYFQPAGKSLARVDAVWRSAQYWRKSGSARAVGAPIIRT